MTLAEAIARVEAAHANYVASRSVRDLMLFDDACAELLRVRNALATEHAPVLARSEARRGRVTR